MTSIHPYYCVFCSVYSFSYR